MGQNTNFRSLYTHTNCKKTVIISELINLLFAENVFCVGALPVDVAVAGGFGDGAGGGRVFMRARSHHIFRCSRAQRDAGIRKVCKYFVSTIYNYLCILQYIVMRELGNFRLTSL